MKYKKGDLVQITGVWKNKVGLVLADEKDWWVIKGHYDVCHCIVDEKEIVLIKKQVVPKKYIKKLA